MENGIEQQMYIVTANSCSWQGWASYYVSRALISPQKLYERVQCMLLAFFLVWYHDVVVRTQVPRRLATVPCIGATLTTVVRPRSDRASRCTDKDRNKETEDRALFFPQKTTRPQFVDYYFLWQNLSPLFLFLYVNDVGIKRISIMMQQACLSTAQHPKELTLLQWRTMSADSPGIMFDKYFHE